MSWKLAGLVAIALVAGITIAYYVQDPETGTATWDSTRASGFAAYLLLWASVVLGLSIHLRIKPAGGPMTWMIESHRMTSALALSFVVAHVFALLLDDVVPFSPLDAFVPFTSSFRPLQVGAGTLAQWLLVIVLASTALSTRMPYATWRKLHYLSFPCWVLAEVHGLTSGTDSGASLAIFVYATTGASVAALLVVRASSREFIEPERAPRPVRR
ncbi:MAG: ferric reductase-like transmembrane domain-containing protein [Dehalococcoidia bacterium]